MAVSRASTATATTANASTVSASQEKAAVRDTNEVIITVLVASTLTALVYRSQGHSLTR